MKRITLLFSLFISSYFVCIAQTPTAQLVVFSEQGERFQVVLNGLLQNQEFKTNVRLKDLTSEYYTCKIMFEDATIPDIDKNYLPTPLNEEMTYKVKKNNKGKYELKWVSEKPLSNTANPTPVVNNPNPVITQPNPTTNPTPVTNSGQPGVNVNINLGELGFNMNANLPNNPNPVNTGGNTQYIPVPVVYVPGYNGPIGCPQPMDAGSFGMAKQTIANQSFEDSKMQVAKQVLSSNCITSGQVKELMGEFDFENTKLDFAKYCYARVYDIGNYFVVNDVFDFSSSVDDLNRYIQANPVRPYQPQMQVPQNNNPGRPRTAIATQQVNVLPAQTAQSGGKCPYPASDVDFSAMKNTISKQSFDNTKLSTAKQIVSANCLRAVQIKELVSMFSFENTKVDLAKYCYSYCYDPQNYFQIYDVFSFKSSTDEVSKYIMGK